MASELLIKVCGMTSPDNIVQVAALAPSMMGFIFYRGSSRCADTLSPEAVASLPKSITPVAVFVDAPIPTILSTASRYGFSTIQLHGHESPQQCRQLCSQGYRIIKAFGIDSSVDWDAIATYQSCVDYFIFDTKTATHGGSGRKFDWQALQSYPLSTPYILSGGISPDDADAIISARQPLMAGIDVNSRFESAPGIKNVSLLSTFISSLRKSFQS